MYFVIACVFSILWCGNTELLALQKNFQNWGFSFILQHFSFGLCFCLFGKKWLWGSETTQYKIGKNTKLDYAYLVIKNIFVSQWHTHYRQKLCVWYSLIPAYITDYTDNFDHGEALVWGNPNEVNRSSRYLLSRAVKQHVKGQRLKGKKWS